MRSCVLTFLACLWALLVGCGGFERRFTHPEARQDKNSMLAHTQLLAKKSQGKIGIYFIGDSITRRWGATDYPAFLGHWNKSFHGWHAADFGWGGDGIQHILWRVQAGELDGVDPRVVVLLAGTNNIGSKAPSEGPSMRAQAILKGLQELRHAIRAKSPAAVLIQMGIFPRDDNPVSAEIIAEVNSGLAAAALVERFRYLDINRQLGDAAGKFKPGLSADGLHLSLEGYEVWAQALKPLLLELLGPPADTDLAPPPTGDPSSQPRAF